MSWGGVKVDDQRIRFVLRACTGKERISDLCREFDISRQTGYYWLARFKEGDEIASLKERSADARAPVEGEQTILAQTLQLDRFTRECLADGVFLVLHHNLTGGAYL